MISYLVHYSWDEGSRSGVGRAFISFDFEPNDKQVVEAERQMSDKQKQHILILSLTKISGEVSK